MNRMIPWTARKPVSYLPLFNIIPIIRQKLTNDCCRNRDEGFEALICLAGAHGYPSFFLQLAEVVFDQVPPLVGFLVEGCRKFRFDFGRMTGMMSRSRRSFRNQSASKALSASKCPADRSRINISVSRRSWACPGIRQSSTRLPSASVRASIFVVMPPRERPLSGIL